LVVLLLANAGYFAWKFHFAAQFMPEQPSSVAPSLPQNVAPLVLLAERPDLLARNVPPNNRVIAPTASRQCYEIGPVAEAEIAATLQAELEKSGIAVEQRLSERRDAEGYWVYLPPSPSQREAQEKLRELQEKGLGDLFVMERGEQRNAISLGLFERLNSARSRMDDLRKLGYQPQMEIQYQTRAEYLIDTEIPAGNADLHKRLDDFVQSQNGLAYRSRECSVRN
jgi:hypothetical protein